MYISTAPCQATSLGPKLVESTDMSVFKNVVVVCMHAAAGITLQPTLTELQVAIDSGWSLPWLL